MARESFEPIDLFHAHIGGMDAFARGLKIAAAIRKDGVLEGLCGNAIPAWDSGIGAEIEAGRTDSSRLNQYVMQKGALKPNSSGRVEMLENILNEYI